MPTSNSFPLCCVQDRSHVVIGDWYHPPMIVLCEALDASVDEQWCLDNCDITGGMPPTGQTCSYDLCRCEEECICEDGALHYDQMATVDAKSFV